MTQFLCRGGGQRLMALTVEGPIQLAFVFVII